MDHPDGNAHSRDRPPAATSCAWPARPDQLIGIRAEVRAWLHSLGLSDDTVSDVVCAVNEAVTNAVEHAYQPRQDRDTVEIEYWADGSELRVEVVDRGRWRPGSVDPRGLRGRGITMMRGMVGTVCIAGGPTGTRVSLSDRRLPGATAIENVEPVG